MRPTKIISILFALTLMLIPIQASAQEGVSTIVNDVVAEPVEGQAAYQVTAYVTVAGADGQPITDLTADAFSASQDGSPVEIESVAITELPASVVLVLDTSGSMGFEGKMQAVTEAAAGFIDSLEDGDQVGVVYFNDVVEIVQNLSTDLATARNIVSLLEYEPGAGTCMYDAAYNAVSAATTAPPGRRAVVLLTDGIDELPDQSGPCSQHTVDDVVTLATDSATRVPIYALAVGDRIDSDALSQLATTTGGVFLRASDAGGVQALFDTVAAQIKNQYALTYQTETTSGEHSLTVTVNTSGATAVGTRAFFAPVLPPMLSLSGLDAGALLSDQSQTVRATVSGDAVVTQVTFELGGAILAEDTKAPYEITLNPGELGPGDYTLVVTAALDDGTALTQSLPFEVAAPEAAGEGETGEGEEAATIGELPAWALPVGIGAAVLILVAAIVATRRRPRAKEAGTAAGAQVGPGAGVYGTLIVDDSLSLRKGQVFELSGDLVRMGRGADNQVVVPDQPVSRHHAEIRKEDGGLRVYDLGSTYGTFVGGKKAEDKGLPLADGDSVQLGTRTSMTFHMTWQPQVAATDDRTMDFVPGEHAEAADTLQALRGDDAATVVSKKTPASPQEALDEGYTIPIEGHDTETGRSVPTTPEGGAFDDGSTLSVSPEEALESDKTLVHDTLGDETQQSGDAEDDDTVHSGPPDDDKTLRT